MSARLILLVMLVLAGCTERANVGVHHVPGSGVTERVFVGTTRKERPDGDFGSGRSQTLSFLALDISVPPDRRPGQIRFPVGGHVDPKTQFFATSRTNYADAADFSAALRREVMSRPPGEREIILFVHGFNNTFGDGVLRLAQLDHDFNFHGVAVHFAWPSEGNALGYEFDRDSALTARDGLAELIRTVDRAGAERVVLIGHSMGAFLSMETMRTMALQQPGSVLRLVKSVVLLSPDIDVDVFRSQARAIGTLPDPFFIFVSRRDRALRLSAIVSRQPARLGNIRGAGAVGDLRVTVVDVTEFSKGLGHFTPGNSPALISMLNHAPEMESALRGGEAQRTGLLPGVVMTVRSATELVLSPITAVASGGAQ